LFQCPGGEESWRKSRFEEGFKATPAREEQFLNIDSPTEKTNPVSHLRPRRVGVDRNLLRRKKRRRKEQAIKKKM